MKIDPALLKFGKSMCHTATDAENFMWQILRAKCFMNLKLSLQHVIIIFNLQMVTRIKLC